MPILEIHYRPLPNSDHAKVMDEMLKNETIFNIFGPFGKVTLNKPTPEYLFIIAAGTGAGQATSIIKSLEKQTIRPVTILWWSVTADSELYQESYFGDPMKRSWLTYRNFIDDDGTNLLIKELEKPNFMHTECNQYILTGPPGFVLSCCEKLKNKGINSTRIHSDVFSYAP